MNVSLLTRPESAPVQMMFAPPANVDVPFSPIGVPETLSVNGMAGGLLTPI